MTVRILVNHAAHAVGIFAREGAIENDLCDGYLSHHRLAARFEINRLGETFLGLGAALLVELEPLGRRHRSLVFSRHLPLGRHGFAARTTVVLAGWPGSHGR